MEKAHPYFERLIKIGEKIAERAEKITLPFFEGVPLYDVALFFWRSIVGGSITTRASAIAFSFFIALFPFLIFLFTLIPIIPIDNFQNELLILIRDLVPASTYETIEGTITEIITKPRGDLLSFGFFLALIFSTNGLASMMSAFDATVNSIYRRSWLSQRFAAILMLLVLSFLLTLAIALLTGGQVVIQYLEDHFILHDRFTVYLITFGKWVVIIALFFFAYSFLYYMAPAKKSKWRFISAGGTLSTILSIFVFAGFTYYINNFSQYNKLYGSIGTLLIILLLIYVMSLILLVGFELNASIHSAQNKNLE
ncbi:MAG: YihY/virulence factor BrkB family protein [Draconibacterium sp.]